MGGMDIPTFITTVLSSTVLATAVTGIITWRVQTKALAQTRLTENLRLFAEFVPLANGLAGPKERQALRSEQIAGIELIASLGRSYPPLNAAAIAFLDTHIDSFKPGPHHAPEIHAASVKARARLN